MFDICIRAMCSVCYLHTCVIIKGQYMSLRGMTSLRFEELVVVPDFPVRACVVILISIYISYSSVSSLVSL